MSSYLHMGKTFIYWFASHIQLMIMNSQRELFHRLQGAIVKSISAGRAQLIFWRAQTTQLSSSAVRCSAWATV